VQSNTPKPKFGRGHLGSSQLIRGCYANVRCGGGFTNYLTYFAGSHNNRVEGYVFTTGGETIVNGAIDNRDFMTIHSFGAVVQRSRAEGVAIILNGTNSIVVAHGLTGTPVNIRVTGTHAEVESCYVSTVGAVNFTVHKGGAGNVTANRDVYWTAKD